MKYTLQVAPEDCTGCALCVEVCPAKNKTEAKLKAINMAPAAAAARAGARQLGLLPDAARMTDRKALKLDAACKDSQLLQPLFEFSRRLRRLRRDAVPQAADASCSATARIMRQRHRLLVDLRRQPADHALRA